MKKAIIFFIFAIYLVSIVSITFFGLKPISDQFKIYMKSIELTSYDEIVNGMKILTIDFNETEKYGSVFLSYEYTPETATEPNKVEFYISGNTYTDENGEELKYADVFPNGEVVFYKRKAVTVTITTTDGSNQSDTLLIICK